MTHYRVISRSSALAKQQVSIVEKTFRQYMPNSVLLTQYVKTPGDMHVGSIHHLKNAFVGTLSQLVRSGEVDFAVHSLKDMSVFPVEGLMLGAVLARGPAQDVFVSYHFSTFEDMPAGAVVGTCSARRAAQIRHRYPQLRICLCRGNISTRLQKLRAQQFDALCLAAAGIVRLSIDIKDLQIQLLSLDRHTPACGQGVIALEIATNRVDLCQQLSVINHCSTHAKVFLERSLVQHLGGYCGMPVGVHIAVNNNQYDIRVFLGDVYGVRAIERKERWPIGLKNYMDHIDLLVKSIYDSGGEALLKQAQKDIQKGFYD